MTAIQFRLAEREDIAPIVDLLTNDSLGKGREIADLGVYLKAFDDMVAQGDNNYLLATDGDVILGCLQLTIIAGLSRSGMKRAQIEGVRVSETARGRGIGKQMMEYAHTIAWKKGCGLVQLTTDRFRERSLEFYQSLGYENSHHGLKLSL